jgi:hypothetical protein
VKEGRPFTVVGLILTRDFTGQVQGSQVIPIVSLLWWDYLEGGSKLMADCLDFDENFELGKI